MLKDYLAKTLVLKTCTGLRNTPTWVIIRQIKEQLKKSEKRDLQRGRRKRKRVRRKRKKWGMVQKSKATFKERTKRWVVVAFETENEEEEEGEEELEGSKRGHKIKRSVKRRKDGRKRRVKAMNEWMRVQSEWGLRVAGSVKAVWWDP